MADEKPQIRKRVLDYRRLLEAEVFATRSKAVVEAALSLIERNKAGTVHCFLPIGRNKEVDTWPLIDQLSRGGVAVVVSATDFDTQTMTHFHYSEDLVLVPDRFDIPTPTEGRPADIAAIDLVLIPMLAGDCKGNRIGYGKGYYDRLLAGMHPDVLKVGLTLGPLFDHFTFAEPHDIRLDYTVTPYKTMKFT